MNKVKTKIISIEEIEKLIEIETEEDLLKLYPDAKFLYSKITFGFFKIKPKLWIKYYYYFKNGECIIDKENNGLIQAHTDDIDFDKIKVYSIYTGNEKKQEYKTIYKYVSKKN